MHPIPRQLCSRFSFFPRWEGFCLGESTTRFSSGGRRDNALHFLGDKAANNVVTAFELSERKSWAE